ncbi:UNVERIFIED_CONTAM: hypothetical protein K2H54_065895, partial [Gekko kuhli]
HESSCSGTSECYRFRTNCSCLKAVPKPELISWLEGEEDLFINYPREGEISPGDEREYEKERQHRRKTEVKRERQKKSVLSGGAVVGGIPVQQEGKDSVSIEAFMTSKLIGGV